MQNQATLLYQLQAVDQESTRHRARLKEIEALLNSDETIARATQQLEAAEKTLKPWQARARDLDLEIKSIADKVKTTDADLYSGRIRNPKALQELQDEIESLRRRQNQLEDDMLEAMVEVEDHQTEIAGAQQTLADARSALSSRQIDLLEEQERLEAEVARAEQQRKTMASLIDPGSLATYEKLRPRFRGQVVALLENEGCSICGVGQTSMGVKQIRSGRTLVLCESCGRILADIS